MKVLVGVTGESTYAADHTPDEYPGVGEFISHETSSPASHAEKTGREILHANSLSRFQGKIPP